MIYRVSQDCKELGGPALKAIKCVSLPLCEYSVEILDKIKNRIAKNIPKCHKNAAQTRPNTLK